MGCHWWSVTRPCCSLVWLLLLMEVFWFVCGVSVDCSPNSAAVVVPTYMYMYSCYAINHPLPSSPAHPLPHGLLVGNSFMIFSQANTGTFSCLYLSPQSHIVTYCSAYMLVFFSLPICVTCMMCIDEYTERFFFLLLSPLSLSLPPPPSPSPSPFLLPGRYLPPNPSVSGRRFPSSAEGMAAG